MQHRLVLLDEVPFCDECDQRSHETSPTALSRRGEKIVCKLSLLNLVMMINALHQLLHRFNDKCTTCQSAH